MYKEGGVDINFQVHILMIYTGTSKNLNYSYLFFKSFVHTHIYIYMQTNYKLNTIQFMFKILILKLWKSSNDLMIISELR